MKLANCSGKIKFSNNYLAPLLGECSVTGLFGNFSQMAIPGIHLAGIYLSGIYLAGIHLSWIYLAGIYLAGIYLAGIYLEDTVSLLCRIAALCGGWCGICVFVFSLVFVIVFSKYPRDAGSLLCRITEADAGICVFIFAFVCVFVFVIVFSGKYLGDAGRWWELSPCLQDLGTGRAEAGAGVANPGGLRAPCRAPRHIHQLPDQLQRVTERQTWEICVIELSKLSPFKCDRESKFSWKVGPNLCFENWSIVNKCF